MSYNFYFYHSVYLLLFLLSLSQHIKFLTRATAFRYAVILYKLVRTSLRLNQFQDLKI